MFHIFYGNLNKNPENICLEFYFQGCVFCFQLKNAIYCQYSDTRGLNTVLA